MVDLLRVPFEITDLRSFASGGAPSVAGDGGLEWAEVARAVGGDGVGAAGYAWSLTAADHPLGSRTLSLDLSTRAPALPADKVARLARFLDDLDLHDATARAAVRRGFDGDLGLGTGLVPDLLHALEPPYLDALFGARTRAGALAPCAFLRGLTLCRVGYYAGDGAGEAATESIVVDYRLLVPFLIEADRARADVFLTYAGHYDVTNQVLAATFSPDGDLRDLAVES